MFLLESAFLNFSQHLFKFKHFYFIIFSINFSIGENIKLLIDRPDGTYCFRLHKDRVFYCRYDLFTFLLLLVNLSFLYFMIYTDIIWTLFWNLSCSFNLEWLRWWYFLSLPKLHPSKYSWKLISSIRSFLNKFKCQCVW